MQQASIRCQAAVAWAPNRPLSIERVDVSPPKSGQIRMRVTYASVSQKDVMALQGVDLAYPRPRFPVILGLEGAGIVESVGEGVKSVSPGDAVIPVCLPQCRKCKFCDNPKTNWCQSLDESDPDEGIFSCHGKSLFSFGGVGSFAEYTVCEESAVVKIDRPRTPLDQLCLDKLCFLSCDFLAGYGAALNYVEPNCICAIFGLGATGLAAIAGCRKIGARQIIGFDSHPDTFALAKKFGATDLVVLPPFDSAEVGRYCVDAVRKSTGCECCDFVIETTGNPEAVKQAIEASNKQWGSTIVATGTVSNLVIGNSLAFGRKLRSSFFGGFKMRDVVSKLVDEYLKGDLQFVNDLATHQSNLLNIKEAFELVRSGQSIKTVINMLY